MFTERTEQERIAEQLAQNGYNRSLDLLSDIDRAWCLRIADQILWDMAKNRHGEDKVLAKTWGGDIDLVSFEGE